MFDLTGKAALVTGASGAIGAAIARALHDCGATVALTGTRAEALATLESSLKERAHAIRCDLRDPAQIDALAADAERTLGAVDILVNNAGVTRDGLALRMTDEDWQAILDINLTAAFRLTRPLLRGMMKRRAGRIINMTSVVGVTGNPGQANYAAAKAGMIGMTKAIAAEVAARGITVNCVAPGMIDTPMTEALTDKQRERVLEAIPTGALGTPADVAAGVVYLASDEAAYVTGQTLHINGGLAMI